MACNRSAGSPRLIFFRTVGTSSRARNLYNEERLHISLYQDIRSRAYDQWIQYRIVQPKASSLANCSRIDNPAPFFSRLNCSNSLINFESSRARAVHERDPRSGHSFKLRNNDPGMKAYRVSRRIGWIPWH